MFLLIDNYDSFTYNLAQAFLSLDAKPVVYHNDDPAILDLARDRKIQTVCVSPGPGRPEEAGLCPEFLNVLDADTPVLGVCLGCQLLGAHGGAKVDVAPVIMHGKQSEIFHDGQGIFQNLPNPMLVARYHSLVVKDDENIELPFTVTARGPEGEAMALRYKERPWYGVQFHPESILTPDGGRLLGNFLRLARDKSLLATRVTQILETLGQGRDLSPELATAAFGALMDGDLTPGQAGAFLMGLRAKGESATELAKAAHAALARAATVPPLSGDCIDVVGTGGDGKNSFNCSTAAALTLAGMGYKVVKHGNRAVSSTCGAADALEGLGVKLEADPVKALEALDKTNFTFLFAPHYHPSFRNVGPLRKELGIRTLFNILGPMINPARPNHLLMGVARPELVDLIASTLAQNGLKRAAVVCGAGGYDELTPLGPAESAIIDGDKITRMSVDPARYGIRPCSQKDLSVGSKDEAIRVLKEILRGEGSAAMRDMVVLNVALALVLLEKDMDMDAAMRVAREAVDSGVGAKTYEYA